MCSVKIENRKISTHETESTRARGGRGPPSPSRDGDDDDDDDEGRRDGGGSRAAMRSRAEQTSTRSKGGGKTFFFFLSGRGGGKRGAPTFFRSPRRGQGGSLAAWPRELELGPGGWARAGPELGGRRQGPPGGSCWTAPSLSLSLSVRPPHTESLPLPVSLCQSPSVPLSCLREGGLRSRTSACDVRTFPNICDPTPGGALPCASSVGRRGSSSGRRREAEWSGRLPRPRWGSPPCPGAGLWSSRGGGGRPRAEPSRARPGPAVAGGRWGR